MCRTEHALFIEAFISLRTLHNCINVPRPTPCPVEDWRAFIQILCLLQISWWFVKSRNKDVPSRRPLSCLRLRVKLANDVLELNPNSVNKEKAIAKLHTCLC